MTGVTISSMQNPDERLALFTLQALTVPGGLLENNSMEAYLYNLEMSPARRALLIEAIIGVTQTDVYDQTRFISACSQGGAIYKALQAPTTNMQKFLQQCGHVDTRYTNSLDKLFLEVISPEQISTLPDTRPSRKSSCVFKSISDDRCPTPQSPVSSVGTSSP